MKQSLSRISPSFDISHQQKKKKKKKRRRRGRGGGGEKRERERERGEANGKKLLTDTVVGFNISKTIESPGSEETDGKKKKKIDE